MNFMIVFYWLIQVINVVALLCLPGLFYIWPKHRIFLSQPSLEKLVEVNFLLTVLVLLILIGGNVAWLFYQRFYLVNCPKRWFHFVVPFVTGGFSCSFVWNWYTYITATPEKFKDIELIRNKTWSLLLEPDYSRKIQNLNDWYSLLQPDETLLPKWLDAPFNELTTQLQHRDYVVSYLQKQKPAWVDTVVVQNLTWWGWCKEHPFLLGSITVATIIVAAAAVVYFNNKKKPKDDEEDLSTGISKLVKEVFPDNKSTLTSTTVGTTAVEVSSNKVEFTRAPSPPPSPAVETRFPPPPPGFYETRAPSPPPSPAVETTAQQVFNITIPRSALPPLSTRTPLRRELEPQTNLAADISSWCASQEQADDFATFVRTTKGAVVVGRSMLADEKNYNALANQCAVYGHPPEPDYGWPGKLHFIYSTLCSYYNHYVVGNPRLPEHVRPTDFLSQRSGSFESNIQTVSEWRGRAGDLTPSERQFYLAKGSYRMITSCLNFIYKHLGI